jgi:hypothetical protein
VGVFGQLTGQAGFKPIITVPEMYYNVTVDFIPTTNLAFNFKKLPFIPGSLAASRKVWKWSGVSIG